MTKQEYIDECVGDLQASRSEYRFNNYKNQIIAKKLNGQFNSTFDESLLWSKALFVSSNACMLLLENRNANLALNSLREAAEVYENLGLVSEKYDRKYALVLASLCYDLAGYQANSRCLIRQTGDYLVESEGNWEKLDSTNYIMSQICSVLLKNIPFGKSKIGSEFDTDFGVKAFNSALDSWIKNALNGTDGEYIDLMRIAYRYFLNASNVFVSHLLFLLLARFVTYDQRSIWKTLKKFDFVRNDLQWAKYIKLLTHDYYDRDLIKPVSGRVSKFEFWTSQLRAIESGLLSEDSNFIIQMPTSAGKTFVAELAIVNALIRNPGKKCVYISPFRALTNEKEAELAEYLSKLGYSVSALSGSYEMDEFQNIILEETDILVATPEKIDLLLRVNPTYFENVALLVVDEGHIVGDVSARSTLMEFLIIRLRTKLPELRILFISAVMPPENADEYSLWLNGREDKVLRSLLHPDSSINEEWEPTRKLIGAFTWDGDNGRISFKSVETEDEESKVRTGVFVPSIIRAKQYGGEFPNKTKKAQTSVSIAYELSKQGNCLIFCAQQRDTISVGKAFLQLLDIVEREQLSIADHFNRNTERESYYFARKWFGENDTITRCLERGIGIHFGDLPEPVRRGVEADYNSGRLRILISTNTVGQGLNFPIKYLIIHSTIITHGQKVKVRDFWNIVGRAGRAGKETEGQIIFNIRTPTDRTAYDSYTNKANIESALSMFFFVLNTLVRGRISEETFENYLKILAEPYLMSLLIEETLETEDQDTIESIINNSLFKAQADKAGISIDPLRNSFRIIITNLRQQVPVELSAAFGETGFVLTSNLAIANYIDDNLNQLSTHVDDDNYDGLLQEIFTLFDSGNIEEMQSNKLDGLKMNPTATLELARNWISGMEIERLQEIWTLLDKPLNLLHVLIADGFFYRYPWGIASFLTILLAKLGRTRESLGSGISNLSTFLKFGVNNPTACLAKGLGIRNRDVALFLAERSNNLEGKDFIIWLANQTIEDIRETTISTYDKQNILNIAGKLTPHRYVDVLRSYVFDVRGIPYENIRKATSLTIQLGDILVYRRDMNNPYDSYAIRIFKADQELGFVPREYSKQISVDLDIDDTEYRIRVIELERQTDYRRIRVEMAKQSPRT